MEEIMRLAKKHGAFVIEDAAHSLPARLDDGTFAGTLGDAGVYSFYATKTITTGEGGMVVTRDKKIAERVGVMRSHGIDRPVFSRYTDNKADWYYEVVAPGFKYNLPDLLAALGRVQLRRAQALFEMRRDIALRYDEAFGGDERFVIPPRYSPNSWHLYPLRIRPDVLGSSRDEFVQKLKERGIGVSVHYIPLHIMPYYRGRFALRPEDFPETMAAYSTELSLPIWPGMTEEMVGRVIEAVTT
jgi:dTDP-4-amino-4,6-dideoxygalactose transaminase